MTYDPTPPAKFAGTFFGPYCPWPRLQTAPRRHRAAGLPGGDMRRAARTCWGCLDHGGAGDDL